MNCIVKDVICMSDHVVSDIQTRAEVERLIVCLIQHGRECCIYLVKRKDLNSSVLKAQFSRLNEGF